MHSSLNLNMEWHQVSAGRLYHSATTTVEEQKLTHWDNIRWEWNMHEKEADILLDDKINKTRQQQQGYSVTVSDRG